VLRLAALLLVAVALVGCGSSQSASRQVTSVTRRYFAAVAAGNGPEACSLLSDAAKVSLRRGVTAVQPNAFNPMTPTCPQDIQAAHALMASEALAQLRTVALGPSAVSGNRATVRAVLGSRNFEVPLSKTPAGWRIGGPVTLPASTIVGRVGPAAENLAALEVQLSAGEVRAAAINKRIHIVHVTLRDGRKALVRYARHEEPGVAASLRAKGVSVTIMTQAEAERDAATLGVGQTP
jgi:hypothetical protein